MACFLKTIFNKIMGKKRNFGFKKTEFDGTEYIFSAPQMDSPLPEKYSYKKYLPGPVNQGNNPICVPCSISAFINWAENLHDGNVKDNHIAYFDIYDSKTTDGEGMTFKEAVKYLKNIGVSTDNRVFKIKKYSLVKSMLGLKSALIMNGPCVGALPVYNWDDDFWIKKPGNSLVGYHAISIAGYDSDGIIIRNSWGYSYGNEGYSKLNWEDLNKFVEIWTVVD